MDGRYVVQRILCLDLYNLQQAIVCLLQVFRLRNTANPLHWERRAASLAHCRKFGRPNECFSVFGCVEQRYYNSVR